MRKKLNTSYGINYESVLTERSGFDVTKQLIQDIMHTILEGILQCEVRLVLHHFIENNILTISNLNAAITNHDYGYTEVSDKPGPLRETVCSGTERYKLKYKAAQARLFLKLLPFYLASSVDKENDFFFLLTNLQQIVIIIYSPVITSITVEELRTLISDHLSLFKQLFPESNILPKQHYIIIIFIKKA